MKAWYLSKTIWFNFIMTLVDLSALVTDMVPDRWKVVPVLIHGVGNIILRRWFTESRLV